MSHSTVLVVLPPGEGSINDRISVALAPFDENVEVEPYVEMTKEQQIAAERQRHVEAAENLQKYRAGQPPYDRPVLNLAHLKWIEIEAPALSKLDDAALWDHIVKTETWSERDDDGAIWSTYNPRSKWDWWTLGGRWPNSLTLKEGEVGENGELSWVFDAWYGYSSQEEIEEAKPRPGVVDAAFAQHVDWSQTPTTFALLDVDGVWYEQGEMGWFGHVSDEMEPDQWDQQWNSLVSLIPDDATVAVVDIHI